MIVDFHTHCFPDDLAARALPRLEERAGVKAALDGTLGALRRSMGRAGIDVSVVQQIATRPGQERTINGWAAAVRDQGIICFGSLHPDSPDWREELRRLIGLGLPGVKFHPDYQDFFADDPKMFPIYESVCAAGLPILFHAGIDIGLPDPCHGRPQMLRKVFDRFPEGKWIAAHLGGYLCWDEVRDQLIGRPVYLDTSYTFHRLGAEGMRELIRAHGADRILFGSDSPWADQARAVEEIKSLGLAAAEEEAVLGGNARRLLGEAAVGPAAI